MTEELNTGDRLETYVQWFEASEDATQEERRLSERDRDYYDNKQLTAEEISTLKKRGQPVIIINRIKRKIDFLRGVEAQQRTDPKAFPRNPQDEQAAHAATDALRFVADNNDLDQIRSEVWENLLIEGMGGCIVRVEAKAPAGGLTGSTAMMQPRYEIVIEHVPWDRLFRDPHSRRADFSDARYFGIVMWMDAEEAILRYPHARADLDRVVTEATTSDTYADRPHNAMWVDGKRKRVRICQIWHRHGRDWHFCTFTKGAKLEGGPSPYVNEDGETEPDMILVSAYVNRENERYGVVREMIGPQDEINKRRSKALHLLNSRQTYGRTDVVDDPRVLRQELAKPDGHIEINQGKYGEDFGVIPTGDMTAGHFQLLQEAKNEIDLMGPNAAMQGKSPASQSGRAIMAQQQGGYVELGPMMDRLRHFNIRVYRTIWNRIRQFWTEERWIRVTDDERNVRFVGLNTPVQDPQTGEITMIQPARMAVDIIVDEAPDSITIQHEQFQQMVELARGGIPIPPDVIIESSQLRNKDKLLEMMRAGQSPAAQQEAAIAQELARREQQAKVVKTEADAQKTQAEAAKTMAEIGMGDARPEPLTLLDRAEQEARILDTVAGAEKKRAEAMARAVEMYQPVSVVPQY